MESGIHAREWNPGSGIRNLGSERLMVETKSSFARTNSSLQELFYKDKTANNFKPMVPLVSSAFRWLVNRHLKSVNPSVASCI